MPYEVLELFVMPLGVLSCGLNTLLLAPGRDHSQRNTIDFSLCIQGQSYNEVHRCPHLPCLRRKVCVHSTVESISHFKRTP